MPGLIRFERAYCRLKIFLFFIGAVFCTGCESVYPEVVVINKTSEHILFKDISFSGCLWHTVIGFDEATSPGRCLPGSDRIHFKKFDAESHCQEQAEDGTMDGICLCDGGTDSSQDTDSVDEGLINVEPIWFNYQTVSVKKVDYGEFHVYEITLDNMEQDFSVPGPYGH